MSTKAMNGHSNDLNNSKFIETIDRDDPQYQRDLQRPADVKEDMRQMESRQRVSNILNSQAFKEELESIIADQMKNGPQPSSLIALQQISELLMPNITTRYPQITSILASSSCTGANGNGSSNVIPINDIRGIDTLNYAKGERLIRCKLASLYRLIDLYGWANGISNHISVRLNQDLDQYLVNPYGLLYPEISASSLIKVNSSGTVVEQGSTTYGVNKSAFSLHGAVYKARPDIRCIIHIHTQTVTAISVMKCGLLPISQEAILCGSISYHDYKGVLNEDDIKKLLAQDLGPINKVMFLRNHGVIACGETIEEACHYLFNIMAACDIQSRALIGGIDNIIVPSIDVQKKLIEMSHEQSEAITMVTGVDNANKKWKAGELEFEAFMRCLDNAGYRTGYMYKQPIMRPVDSCNKVKEIEIPPAATSHCYDMEYIKKLKDEKSKMMRGEWLNTPNVYSRTETQEIGTSNPKKITKWIPENSPNKTSTPIRIENKHQFAPQGADPRELKNHQKQVKQKYYADKIDAGPESKLLNNFTHYFYRNNNNNKKMNSKDLNVSQTSGNDIQLAQQQQYLTSNPSTTLVFGAVSKGIIKRDQQHNAGVYKSPYALNNPFQQMDPNELEKYRKEIAQKQIKEQAQRKDNLHKELLENVELSSRMNKSEIISTEPSSAKKKAATIPRSKSLLEKKGDKDDETTSQNSSIQTSRDSSPTLNESSSSHAAAAAGTSKSSKKDNKKTNKSATISGANSSQKQQDKPVKPKKKSKLSFLSRKKKDSTTE